MVSSSSTATVSLREDYANLQAVLEKVDRMRAAKDLIAETATEEEKMAAATEKLNSLKPELIRLLGTEAEANEVLSRAIENLDKKAAEVNTSARDMGWAFSSAFEDAIIEGEKFSNVLQGLTQDIARIALRTAITQPLGSALGEGIANVLPWGGARASGGPIIPGRAYLVGEKGPEIITPHASGSVIPNNALGGGGDLTVIINDNAGNQVTADQHMTPDGRVLEIMIDRAVAKNIGQFGSQTNKALKTANRLTPR